MKISLVRYFRIPLIYFLFSVAWIFGTDLLVNTLIPNPEEIFLLSVIKGTGFVILSTLLIFLLLKEDERRQKATQSELEQSRKSFSDLFAHHPQPMWIYDRDSYDFLAVNEQAQTLYGYTARQFLSMKILELHPGDDREIFKQTVLSGEIFNQETGPWHHRKLDGQELYVRVFSVVLQFAGRNAVLSSVLDTGTVDRIASELRKVQKEKDEMESFSYSVSHDLKAPLRAITGYSQALLEDYHDRLDEAGTTFLESLKTNADRMNELIDDLLRLSRIDRQEIHLSRVNLSRIFKETADELGSREPHRKVEWIIAPDVYVVADESLLRIAVQNLAGNAFKFTRRQPAARIEFSHDFDETRGLEVYRVRDNGEGFDMQQADRLFVPFQRLHKPGEYEGTGIGLSIVHRILQRHHGEIWAESNPGQGTVFSFTLRPMWDRKPS